MIYGTMRILVSIFLFIMLTLGIMLGRQNTINNSTKITNSVQVETPQIEIEEPIYQDYECLQSNTPTTVLKAVNLPMYSGEDRANRILFDYIMRNYKKELKVSSKAYITVKDFDVNSVRAFEYDLDSDGVNEIIGISYQCFAFGGLHNTDLFILKKFGKEYKEIGKLTYAYVSDVVIILQEKSNNYYNIQFREQIKIPNRYHIIKYNETDKYHFEYFCH